MRKLALILLIGLIAFGSQIYIADTKDHRPQEFITPSYNVTVGDTFEFANEVTIEDETFSLTHVPITSCPSNESLDIEVTVNRIKGRIVTLRLFYEFSGDEEKSQEMVGHFKEEYLATQWESSISKADRPLRYHIEVEYTQKTTDIYRYRDRAKTILDGELLYRDTTFRTETPPLINYFLVVPYLLEPHLGLFNSFNIFFTMFALINSVLIFLIFRRWDAEKAALASLIYISYPFAVFYTTKSLQDDTISLFSILIPLYFLLEKKFTHASVLIGIFIMIKMWTALLVPVVLFYTPTNKERMKNLILICTIASLIILPFLIFAGKDTIYFIKFYFGLTERAGLLGGFPRYMSISFRVLLLAAMVIGMLILFYQAKKNLWDVWPVTVAFIYIFFIFYFKTLYGYFSWLIVFMLPLVKRDYRIIYSICILLLGYIVLVLIYHTGYDSIAPFGIFLVLVILLSLYDIVLCEIYIICTAVFRSFSGIPYYNIVWSIILLVILIDFLRRVWSSGGSKMWIQTLSTR